MPSKDIKTVKPKNGPVRTVIKVKTEDGGFQTIIPMTDTASVLGVSGRTIDIELADIQRCLSSNTSSIEVLSNDTKDLVLDMTSLVDYVNPLMDELKSHMEIIDSDNEVDSTIFDHVYDELDTMHGELDALNGKISTIESSLTTIMSKLDKVITDNSNLTKKVDNLITSNSTLTNTVDDLVVRLEQHQDTII